MAVTGNPVSATVTTTERTWRATIDPPYGAAPPGNQGYTLTLHREKRTFDAAGNQIGDAVVLAPIVLSFSAIAAQSVTVGGATLTVTQLAAFLEAAFDQMATSAETAAQS